MEHFSAILPKCTHLLDEVVKYRIPRASSGRWSDSRLVQTLLQHLPHLCQVFQKMMGNSDGETFAMASGFDLWLSKASTREITRRRGAKPSNATTLSVFMGCVWMQVEACRCVWVSRRERSVQRKAKRIPTATEKHNSCPFITQKPGR